MNSPNPNVENDFDRSVSISDMHFNTFEQCNDYMKYMDEVDLYQYLDIAKHIPYDHTIIRLRLSDGCDEIESIIRYFISTSKYQYRAFSISVSSLNTFGFDLESFTSRTPKWVQTIIGYHDSNIDRELRFLKKNKLIENIDYISMNYSDNDNVSIAGYNITKLALYKIVSNKYGIKFLESIIERMGKLLYYFNEYKCNFKSSYVQSLQRTINGLNDDIKELNELNHKHNISYAQEQLVDAEHQRYSANQSNDSCNSYISSDAIMDSKPYIDEISNIHLTMENMINKVDGRISNVDYKLANLASKIDDLVGSIALSKDECQSMCSRCSTTRNTNPVLDHVHDIFREYEKISHNKPVRASQRRSRICEFISSDFEQEL